VRLKWAKAKAIKQSRNIWTESGITLIANHKRLAAKY